MFNMILQDKNTIVISDKENEHFFTIRILEDYLINIKSSTEKEITLPTWTITPGDTELPFEGLSRYDQSNFSCPQYEISEEQHHIIIKTKSLKLIIDKEDFYCSWYDLSSSDKEIKIMQDRKTGSYQHQITRNHPTCHYLNRDKNEMYFGLGEKSGKVNKHGRRFRMKNIDAMGYNAETTDPLYKHIPYYLTYKTDENVSFGIFYDDYQDSIVDLGQELDNYHGHYRYYETKSDFLDYYVIAGPTIQQVTTRFSHLTGRPTLMPEWSLSYSGSTMQYTDLPNSDERLISFLNQCNTHNITIRSFHLSSGYTSIHDKRYVFNWNYDKFKDPKSFGKAYTDQNVELVANIKPTLLTDHPLLDEVLAFDGFIKDMNGQPLLVQFWDEKGYYLDFTNKDTIKWWQSKIEQQLLSNHVNCTWNDNNEFEIWDDKAKVNGFGNEANFQDYKAIMPILMMKASREIQQQYHKEEYPYIISRSGAAGMSKYVQTWTGDNYTSWHTLKYNNAMAIGLSLSGVYNFGNDIGGFSGDKPEAELFLRWVQCGAYYPRFSIHSWNDDGSVNEPWMHNEVLSEVKQAMHFHEKLKPYLQSLVVQAHEAYEPIIRPTFYQFESDINTFEENEEFMLGEHMLIAPIVEKAQLERTVYLPKNNKGWIDFHSGEQFEGGQTITVKTTLQHIPTFVVKGAEIPVYQDDLKTIENLKF
ncbi:DUF4968 domain-containing protein [Mammaliicoccus sciuri]|uniref:glycoside hydrolase family 31 protein n=1 Tax=Mammaliicoccus sciuri TaxID=1296 RepID=UPI002DB869C0|nr:TIM-barrel domain-containing protein [Mammaliicoccus sciuri]MEB6214709.1 DUF4968 domain-containing protein [Mammaliicoccus sciuri]MEB6329756.1 DUF4968 domain-containing protein [Mammaliicoccus sciuri]